MNNVCGPKNHDHPSIGEKCPICGKPFKEGDLTTLLPLAPTNPQDMAAQRDNKPYNAMAREVHVNCEPIESEDSE